MTTTNILDSVNTALPTLRGNTSTGYTGIQLRNDIVAYLDPIHKRNKNAGFAVGSYTRGATVVPGSAYNGSVYSPTQNRIYFVPSAQAEETYWHYIDCNTGAVVAYANVHYGTSTGAAIGAYFGGVYSPTQNRIYFVPVGQASSTYWHYIDCTTGEVVAYAHGATAVNNAYGGGVYSPTQNRIYFVPLGQASSTGWHYIDCTSTGSVITYQNNSGVSAVYQGYFGGVYSPTQNRIYFVPVGQASSTYWHYIDCTSTGQVVAYQNNSGVVAAAGAYFGGVYSPTQNRIYLVPYAQSYETSWHYIDCNTDEVIAYPNNSGVAPVNLAYSGGVYSPTQNRIYLVPYAQSDETYWHYIDCTSTGSVVSYSHGITAVNNTYIGGVYSPTQNRIYLVPYAQSYETNWHYIQEFSKNRVSTQLMSTTLFNKV
jgi:hypothetical protein